MSAGMQCRSCGRLNDDATAINDDSPKPPAGALAICFYCGTISIFTGAGVEVRQPTDAEWHAVAADPRIGELLRRLPTLRNDVRAHQARWN